MSSRNNDYREGSSRHSRDDSRTHKDRREVKSRTRSRSPRDERPPHSSSRHSPERRNKERSKHNDRVKRSSWEEDEEVEVPAPPPPPRISKISIGFSKPSAPIKMNLNTASKVSRQPKPNVASVFNDDDDDDEPEEMPAEAKMRMRNIGRDTPTSAGPNSFGKTKQGFCDSKKVFERNLKQALETAEKPASSQKFPQTIYKINGP